MASRRVHAKGPVSIGSGRRGITPARELRSPRKAVLERRPRRTARRPGRFPRPRHPAEFGVKSRPAEAPLASEGFMTLMGTSSGRTPPGGLQSAADLVSATRKAILVAAVALVVAIAAIAAAAAPLLNTQLRGDDPAVPTARDLAKRLDQISAELDRLRQGLQQRESVQADLLDQQKRLSDGLAALAQETAEIRTRLSRDLTALRSQLDAMHPQTEEAEKSAAEEQQPRRGRRGRRGRRSMSFTI